jgi:hypothetical protein
VTTAIEPRNQPLIREQIQALREWRMALIGTRVAIAYGVVSAEDRFYLTRSPASQLSITTLATAR